MVEIGELRNLCEIKRFFRTQDGSGQEVIDDTKTLVIAEVWAAIVPLFGFELEEATRRLPETTHRFRTWWLSGTKILASDHIIFLDDEGDRLFEILEKPRNKVEGDRIMEMLVKEVEEVK